MFPGIRNDGLASKYGRMKIDNQHNPIGHKLKEKMFAQNFTVKLWYGAETWMSDPI